MDGGWVLFMDLIWYRRGLQLLLLRSTRAPIPPPYYISVYLSKKVSTTLACRGLPAPAPKEYTINKHLHGVNKVVGFINFSLDVHPRHGCSPLPSRIGWQQLMGLLHTYIPLPLPAFCRRAITGGATRATCPWSPGALSVTRHWLMLCCLCSGDLHAPGSLSIMMMGSRSARFFLPLFLEANSDARGGEHGSRGVISRKRPCIDTMYQVPRCTRCWHASGKRQDKPRP